MSTLSGTFAIKIDGENGDREIKNRSDLPEILELCEQDEDSITFRDLRGRRITMSKETSDVLLPGESSNWKSVSVTYSDGREHMLRYIPPDINSIRWKQFE